MIHKHHLKQACQIWLPMAVITVILAGLVYAAVQQNYRQSANDPQIQIARDVADAIVRGDAQADGIVPPTPTSELANSLATFVAVYSATGTPIGASVSVDGKLPTLPVGVFLAAAQKGENRFTWQPKTGVRVAAVLESFKGKDSGYILVGRSIREVEVRIAQLTIMTGIATALALILSYLAVLWYAMQVIKPEHHEHIHEHTEEHHHHAA
ncbi:MAG: hypothetical protein HY918_06125 [Candidatus Doudnabacteria bacterium]|nr:hypothetical protein [Candidatus Doudnabacteria bacterium]